MGAGNHCCIRAERHVAVHNVSGNNNSELDRRRAINYIHARNTDSNSNIIIIIVVVIVVVVVEPRQVQ